MTETALFETTIKSLPLVHRGKVRDIYAVGDDKLLIVQTDRLSAFDVILPTAVPGKGKILTKLSQFWFDELAHILPNHLTGIAPESVVADNERDQVKDRAFVIRRLKPLPIEVIVRGYVVGSGWKDYQQTGAICGIPLPPDLKLADKLPDGAIFTPSTKAAAGAHDENITVAEAERLLGRELTAQVSTKAIQLYSRAAQYAQAHGIIIADTKFEFGLDEQGELYLIDEVLTPDSSRFWPADQYQPGQNPPSFDKQFVRDWLETQDWNKQAPAPALPDEILQQTVEKYREALQFLVKTPIPQNIINRAFELHKWITDHLDGLSIPRNPRIQYAVSCYDIVIEHHIGITELLRCKVYGSAFALVRPLFETFVRGVWLRHCATDKQIKDYVNDKIDLKFCEILKDVEKADEFKNGILTELKNHAWKAMNSYTHSGFLQASRRTSGMSIEPNFAAEEIIEVANLAGTFALLACEQIAIEAKYESLASEVLKMLHGTAE